jgi:Tfp pilus assembly protein PilX
MRRALRWTVEVLGPERGMALPLALIVLLAFSIGTASVVTYSTTNSHSAAYSLSKVRTQSLADAGINNAAAVLSNPSNNALDPYVFCPETAAGQSPPSLPCWTTTAYPEGSVTWTGQLVQSAITGSYWKLTSISTERNPTGGSAPVRTSLTARVPVYPILTQPLNNPAWNYIFATKPASPLPTCDMTLQQSVQVASPLYVNGNLCLENSSTITKGPLVVRGRLTLKQQANAVGSSTTRLSEAHLANGCEWVWGKRLDTPCAGDADNVWVQSGRLDSNPTSLSPPVPYFDRWYLNASPGPFYPCISPSGPVPVFDSPIASGSATDAEKLTYMNNNQLAFNLTPTTSYTCRGVGGELSWNATTKMLTVSGTIFIDGSAYIQNGAVNEYNGQSTMYLTGTFFMKNSKLCGGLNAGRTDCDYTNWNPNTELLVVVTNGSGGQVSVNDGIQLTSSTFEGAMQAAGNIETDTTSKVDGPLVGSTVILGQSANTSFPTISLVPVGMPSNPAIYAQPGPPEMYSG